MSDLFVGGETWCLQIQWLVLIVTLQLNKMPQGLCCTFVIIHRERCFTLMWNDRYVAQETCCFAYFSVSHCYSIMRHQAQAPHFVGIFLWGCSMHMRKMFCPFSRWNIWKGISENISAWMYCCFCHDAKIILFQTRTDWHLSCWEAPVRKRINFGLKRSINLSAVHRCLSKPHTAVSLFTMWWMVKSTNATRFQNLCVVTPRATAGAESNDVWPSKESLTLGMKLISQPSNK